MSAPENACGTTAGLSSRSALGCNGNSIPRDCRTLATTHGIIAGRKAKIVELDGKGGTERAVKKGFLNSEKAKASPLSPTGARVSDRECTHARVRTHTCTHKRHARTHRRAVQVQMSGPLSHTRPPMSTDGFQR